jgi:serine/threonine protein kinase
VPFIREEKHISNMQRIRAPQTPPVDAERWRRIELIYHAALEREPEQRSSFIAQACLDDEELRGEVQSLLAQGSEAPGPLESPPWDVLATSFENPKQVPLPAGTRIGSYVVGSLIGAGGMGIVYQAKDVKLHRQVALKSLPEGLSDHKGAVERLWREARAASALNHPNIATIHAVEECEGRTFIVMELLEGQDLKQVINEKPVKLETLLELAFQISDGLAAAHSRGILHCDIKPANLFVTGRGQLKILDFGVAKFQTPERPTLTQQTAGTQTGATSMETTLTSTGALVGTIAYMSPEQVMGLELDTRTDLFSFGAVLYEMATGVAPFRGATAALIRASILTQSPVPSARVNPHVPPDLDRVIMKSLEKDPGKRYQSASELRSDLQRVQRDTAARAAKPRRRARIAAAVLLTAVLAAAAFLFWARAPLPEAIPNELLPIRLTANGPDSSVGSVAISPDGRYLAYSDPDGIYVRPTRATQSRLLPNTKGMSTKYWSADGARIFLSDAHGNYSASLLDEHLDPLGDVLPFPDGRHVFHYTKDAIEVRGLDGKVTLSLPPDNGTTTIVAMAPGATSVAVAFAGRPSSAWIDAFQIDTGRRTTLLPPQPVSIDALTWLSGSRLIYSLAEGGSDNLWLLTVDPSSGLPIQPPLRQSRWADFQINQLTATADGRSVCFRRSRFQQNIWTAILKAKEFGLGRLQRLTQADSVDWPWTWTADSKAVVFTSDRARPGHDLGEIYKQNIKEKSAVAIPRVSGVRGSSDVVRLSPDGIWLLYMWVQDNAKKVMRIPVAGGKPRQVLASEGYLDITCSRVPGGACALVETDSNTTTVSLVDPIKGRGARLFREDGVHFAILSPDGKHLAYLIPEKPPKRIRVTNLHGVTEEEISVAGVDNLRCLDWMADGSGFFTSDLRGTNETLLLQVGLSGTAQVLWRLPGLAVIWAIPSPDGRYLATYRGGSGGDAWMVEGL